VHDVIARKRANNIRNALCLIVLENRIEDAADSGKKPWTREKARRKLFKKLVNKSLVLYSSQSLDGYVHKVSCPQVLTLHNPSGITGQASECRMNGKGAAPYRLCSGLVGKIFACRVEGLLRGLRLTSGQTRAAKL
jgi:hypothetical protein